MKLVQSSSLRVRQAHAVWLSLYMFVFLAIRNIWTKYITRTKDLNISFATFSTILHSLLLDAGKTAIKGNEAPNEKIHSLKEPNKEMKLLDFQKKDRLLVLNFGSST